MSVQGNQLHEPEPGNDRRRAEGCARAGRNGGHRAVQIMSGADAPRSQAAIRGGDVNNSWEAMWCFIGVDKLLELVTESIEYGGR